jgi:hypothetical protein
MDLGAVTAKTVEEAKVLEVSLLTLLSQQGKKLHMM